MMRAQRGPSHVWAGRREGEDLLAECISMGFCLHLSCGQQSVILWRMRGRRGLCLQIRCVGMMGCHCERIRCELGLLLVRVRDLRGLLLGFWVLGFKMWRVRVVYRGN